MSEITIKIRDGNNELKDMVFEDGNPNGLVPLHKISGAVDLSRGDEETTPIFVSGGVSLKSVDGSVVLNTTSSIIKTDLEFLTSSISSSASSSALSVSSSVSASAWEVSKSIHQNAIDVSGSVSGSAYTISGSVYNVSSSVSASAYHVSSSVSGSSFILSGAVSASVSDVSSSVSASGWQVSSSIYQNAIDVSGSVSGSTHYLNKISSSLTNISSSTAINTEYTVETYKFNRATEFFSKVYTVSDLIVTNPVSIDLYDDIDLNPGSGTDQEEEYILKAIEIIIQNSCNKNVYLKIGFDELNAASSTNYTIKIPPGIIYSSDNKYSHMRHKIIIENASSVDPSSQVACSIAYNTNLLPEFSTGPLFDPTSRIFSIATNAYLIPFTVGSPLVVGEFLYDNATFDSFKIKGQGRITTPGQTLYLAIKNKTTDAIIAEETITATTPTNFQLLAPSPANDSYVLIASGSGTGTIGDARVLFADVILYNGP